jgi:hypothetical protein
VVIPPPHPARTAANDRTMSRERFLLDSVFNIAIPLQSIVEVD